MKELEQRDTGQISLELIETNPKVAPGLFIKVGLKAPGKGKGLPSWQGFATPPKELIGEGVDRRTALVSIADPVLPSYPQSLGSGSFGSSVLAPKEPGHRIKGTPLLSAARPWREGKTVLRSHVDYGLSLGHGFRKSQ